MKRIALLMAMGALAVAACSPQATSTPDVPTAPPSPSAEAAGGPTPGPTPAITREQVVLPQPDDWVRGPDAARVTFIEWGDFQ